MSTHKIRAVAVKDVAGLGNPLQQFQVVVIPKLSNILTHEPPQQHHLIGHIQKFEYDSKNNFPNNPRLPDHITYSWYVPDGVDLLLINGVGGGGGGSGCRFGNPIFSGSGGGGSMSLIKIPVKVSPGDLVTVSVGRGGRGGDPFQDGEQGLNSIIRVNNQAFTCYGGQGGHVSDGISVAQGGFCGCFLDPEKGEMGFEGGSGKEGNSAMGSMSTPQGGKGGSTKMGHGGSGGKGFVNNGRGEDGTFGGGGGGGSPHGATGQGGNGGNGFVIIEW